MRCFLKIINQIPHLQQKCSYYLAIGHCCKPLARITEFGTKKSDGLEKNTILNMFDQAMSYSSSRSPISFISAPCPVCMGGTIAQMPMMESLGCSFCNHIFTLEKDLDSKQDTLRMADTISTLRWVWTGKRWENANAVQVYNSRWLSVLGILLVLIPTAIMSAAVYIFPTKPDVPLAWFPKFWAIATFCGHLFVLLSIIRDYTQFPIRAYWQLVRRSVRRSPN